VQQAQRIAPPQRRAAEYLRMTDQAIRRALRTELRAALRALDTRQRLLAAQAICDRLRPLLPPRDKKALIAGYWACAGEVPLHPLLAGPYGFRYLLPVLQPGKQLAFRHWQAGEPVVANRYGIPEPVAGERVRPEQLDVVLLPLVGFDRAGHRLGSGGGWYDRSFAFVRQAPTAPRPRLIGVAFALQEVAELPAAEWDVGLDWVVTEREVIDCRAASGASA